MSKQNKKSSTVKKPPVKSIKKETPSRHWLAMVFLVIITLICFSNAFKNEFTNWDDQAYVIDNDLIKSLSFDHIREMFSSYVMGNYHPLSVLSLALDYNLYHLSPHGYHMTSIVIHILNVLLVFMFIRLLTTSTLTAFLTALFFGIHPMHVESVSWVSERKDVLYLFFYMASLCAYLIFSKSQNKKWTYFILSLVLFIFSLLSKGQAVTLPVVLLLIDYFNGRKFDKKLILEKIPFFVISLIMGLIAVIAQKESGAITEIPVFSLPVRIIFSSMSLLVYIGKMILPVNLSAFYPYPVLTGSSYPAIYYAAPVIVLLVLTMFIFSFRKNKNIFFGLAFFFVNIFLLLQLLPVGGSMMSERYTYLCYIGLFFIIGNFFTYIWSNTKKNVSAYKYLFAFVLVIYSGFLGYATVQRNKVWKNSELLWTNVIKQFPEAVIAFGNRGSYYQKAGKLDVALKDFNEALRLKPDHPETLINRSDVYRVNGQYDLSIADCNKALEVKKDYPGAYMNRGIAYCIVGRYNEAFSDFGKVISQDPKNSNVYCNRGNLYDMKGMLDSALSDYSKAIALKPDYSEAYYNRGKTYMRKQNYTAAVENFSQALIYNNKYGEAYFFRSQSYKELKNYTKALEDAVTSQQMGKQVDQNYLNELKSLASGI